jgi:hypothetical protein
MHDTFAMSGGQSVRDFEGNFDGFVQRQRASFKTFSQQLALEEFANEKVRVGFAAKAEYGTDVGVIQPREQLYFALEAFFCFSA